ncbi:N-acetyltransferase [Alcaligenes pakistanensis]|uniref:N-acetyltransferase n=1 Tax=Alcaligenes pakistanensis TaxID=1482717 RepID=A0A8H9M3M8_9BURK|nr:GNAT family N-acetyltransferase [Alcaligenes pakistanensis]MBP6623516.1 GNAT family N-acetyltransferase [Alcaligenes sp.]GHC40137.1 N-acetyltransferase [Alcaligenes pakistanensis]
MNASAFSQPLAPLVLEGWGVRLEPLQLAHVDLLEAAAADGELWNVRVTSVPAPGQAQHYVQTALDGQQQGHMLPFLVRDLNTDQAVGTTRYHDIVAPVARLEIGYTWYARSAQRSHVNTAAKLLLLQHAFETLGAGVVGWRTDHLNFKSQQAISRLGARFDGRIRHHAIRRDGTIRDTMFYSLMAGEWPDTRAHLLDKLRQHSHVA